MRTDYAWYHRNRGDFADLIHELESANQKRPALLALLGCSTRLHFARKITQVAPDMGLLLSKRSIYAADMLEGLYTVLNGVQRMSCGDQWDEDLEAVKFQNRKIGQNKQSFLLIRGFP